MKKLLCMVIIVFFVACLVADASLLSSKPHPIYAPNLVKIKLSPAAVQRTSLPTDLTAETTRFNINELDQLMVRNGGTTIMRAHRQVKNTAWQASTGFDRWFLIKLDGSTSVEAALKSFKENRYIEEAIPEYYAYTTATPNDTYFAYNWGHNNTAQLPVYSGSSHSGAGVGTIGFDSDAQLAWDQSQGYGSASIIIAIIDSGVDTAHPDLRLVTGYDYGDNDSNPMDNSAEPGHGTACAGVAAARANNGLGITGIAGGCSVMPLKVANSAGTMAFTSIENALTHAADNGADVISMSLGAEGGMGEGSSPSTDTALTYAYNAGVVIFAATANANASAIAYPANHNKVISVGAASPTGQRKSPTSSDGETWWGSNYGTAIQNDKASVDICAPTILPATDITGTGNGYNTSSDYYMWFNGTSCATPYAAGVAALLLSKVPTLTPAQVRTAIVNTATDMTIDGGAGWDRYTGYGMVNANAALSSVTPGIPTCQITAPVSGSAAEIGTTVTISATATDSDGTISSVMFYVDDVLKNTDTSSPYSWDWNTTGQTAGTHILKALATDNGNNTAQSTVSINLIAAANEGFESGNFSAYPWSNSSAVPWTVQSTEKYSGTYAAKSGAIGNSASTNLAITLNISTAGNISFFKKVSSESGYDFLRFYLDDVQQAEWSGEASWALHSYAVTTGLHTFRWTYSKDGSDTGGSDCAWIDHLNFPAYTLYFAPAQNLAATGGNNFVNLSWQAPASGTPTGYKIYKNSSLLTTVTGLSYTDNAVTNGTTYSYYLKAVYSGGESDATTTVNATPSNVIISSVTLGTGTGVTSTNAACPVNVYYKSLHGQSVYTAAELAAAGVAGPINITQLGFYISTAPSLALPNFIIRMKHTTATDEASWLDATNMVTVYSNASYTPVAGGYHMLTLSTPFTWNGVDNIVVDTAFSLLGSYSSTGTVQYTTVTNGYRFARSDTANQTGIFTGTSIATTRPNLKLALAPLPTSPNIVVSTSSLSFGNVPVGTSPSQSFNISNTGTGSLTGSITTPTGYSVALNGTKLQARDANPGNRDVLPYTVNAGQSATFTLTFTPLAGTSYTGNVTISHNAGGADKTISLSGTGVMPIAVPFADGFESGIGSWYLANGSQTNVWAVGTAAKQTGIQGAYISNDAGVNNSYTLTSASVAHIYLDIAFPAGTESYKLRFAWKGQGEGTSTFYDYLRVYLIDPSTSPIAGTELATGQLGATYNLVADWQEVTLDIPAGVNGQTKRLVFSWRNDSSLGAQPPAAIDNIRIVAGNQSDAAVIIDNGVVITPPAVNDPLSNPITPSITITGLTGASGYITVTTGYGSVGSPSANAGLDFIFMGANFAGATLNIAHNLGFIPFELSYKIGDAGSWQTVGNPGSWTSTDASFTVPGAKGVNDVFLAFSNSNEQTLPISLSAFTATISSSNNVRLDWVTATETGVLGYYIYRSEDSNLLNASQVSPLIEGTNTSNQQSYVFNDLETQPFTEYNYWLEGLDIDGGFAMYGPVTVSTLGAPDNPTPPVPVNTELIGNYPNPFNPSTVLSYSLDKPGVVDFQIWNNRGQMVWHKQMQHNSPGFYSLLFNGTDYAGRSLSSGVYFCRMTVGKQSYNRKMILMK